MSFAITSDNCYFKGTMVSQTPAYNASLITTNTTGSIYSSSGIGIVEAKIDNATYTIKTPSETITVAIDNGSLSVGERVLLSKSGNTVLIEKVPAPQTVALDSVSLQSGPKMEELARLIKTLRQTLAQDPSYENLVEKMNALIKKIENKIPDTAALIKSINELKQAILTIVQSNPGSTPKAITNQILQMFSLCTGITGTSDQTVNEALFNPPSPAMILAQSSPAFGIYSIKNAQAAQDFLAPYTPLAQGIQETLVKTYGDKPFFIQVTETAVPGTNKAIIMNRDQVLAELAHIQHSVIKSDLVKSIPAPVLVDTIETLGSLSLSDLTALDTQVKQIAQESAAPLLKADALTLFLTHSIGLLQKADTAAVSEALSLASSNIPQLIGELAAALTNADDSAPLSRIVAYILQAMSLDKDTAEKKSFIPALMKNLGLSLEHDLFVLAQGPQSSAPQKELTNLKCILLLVLNQLETFGGSKEYTTASFNKELEANTFLRAVIPALHRSGKAIAHDKALPPEPSMPLQQTSIEAIRKNIETLLQRIEMLQQLAKPITASGTEQQALILPVAIGNEWTELRIKFIKDRKSKNARKASSHISVMLTIDLSNTGSVSASMEYVKKKSLSVSFTFENQRTKKWFENNSASLLSALQELGLPVTQITFHDSSTAPDMPKNKESYPISVNGRQQSTLNVLG